jgi:hypothetical protein
MKNDSIMLREEMRLGRMRLEPWNWFAWSDIVEQRALFQRNVWLDLPEIFWPASV